MNAARSLLWTVAGALFLAAAASPAVAGATAATQGDIDKCRGLGDRVARLACFDGLFATPAEVMSPQTGPAATVPSTAQALPGRWQTLAEDQERDRAPGQVAWLSRIRPWQAGDYSRDPSVQAAAMQQWQQQYSIQLARMQAQAKLISQSDQ